MSVAVRRGLLALVAILVAEAAWIMAVPPFRGSDEIDHTYRAAGVARGEWHLTEGAEHGRGTLVRIPTDIVEAAQGQCLSLKYMLHDNCYPVSSHGGQSVVATAAGAYDPFFYWVVGTAAKPFHGSGADYAMRIATALICAVLLALAVGVLSYAGTGPWASLGVVAAFMPEVFFSGAIPAPNGPEMALAFVLWASLLAVVRVDDVRVRGRLLALAFAAGTPLMFVRLLGPLWVVAIVLSVVAFAGWSTTRRIVAAHRRLVTLGVIAVGLGAVWWETWQQIAAHVTPGAPDKDVVRWVLAFNLPVFTMQMVGAFPYRDIPAPLGVYPLAFCVICLMFFAAWRKAMTPRVRRTVLGIGIASLVIPVAVSLVFMPSAGAVWQGRYEQPFVIGILPLCGLILDDVGFAPREGRRLIGLSAVFLLVAQVACVYHVLELELGRPVSAADTSWVHPPLVVTALLMAVGWVLLCGLLPLRNPEPAAMPELDAVDYELST
ncbi:MAG: DUF2142 domain-containing protein [Nocardioides sp.]